MKKKFCLAIIAISGIILVSCDADGVESAAPQFGKISNQKEVNDLTGRVGDGTSGSTTTNLVVDPTPPGPGDDLPPITPPKPH